MVRFYAISVLAIRDTRDRKGKTVRETCHMAVHLSLEDNMDAERTALRVAETHWYPVDEGFEQHSVSVEELPYEEIREVVLYNEQERYSVQQHRPRSAARARY